MKTAKDTVIKFKLEKINYMIENNFKRIESAPTEEERFGFIKENAELERKKAYIKQEFNGN